MSEVFRFDADAYCIVFCLAGSDIVQMTSNLADARIAEMHADQIRKKGGYVLRVCSAGTLVAALELIRGQRQDNIFPKDWKSENVTGFEIENLCDQDD